MRRVAGVSPSGYDSVSSMVALGCGNVAPGPVGADGLHLGRGRRREEIVEFGLYSDRVGNGLHRIAGLIASRQQPKQHNRQ